MSSYTYGVVFPLSGIHSSEIPIIIMSEQTETLLKNQYFLLEKVSNTHHDAASSNTTYWLSRDASDVLTVQTTKDCSAATSDTATVRLVLLQDAPPNHRALEDVVGSKNIGTTLLWNDEQVNIWEFRIAPVERSAYHTHQFPYIFLNLTESWTQEFNDEEHPVGEPCFQRVGQTTFVEQEHLGSHGVQNVGQDVFLQFVVEFKGLLSSRTKASSS
jgi:hypothetical protein